MKSLTSSLLASFSLPWTPGHQYLDILCDFPRGAMLLSGVDPPCESHEVLSSAPVFFCWGSQQKWERFGVSQKECKQNTSKNNKKPQWTTKSCTWLVKLYLVGGFDPFEKILVKSLTQVDQVGLKITNVWNNHLDPNFFLNSFSGKIRPSKRPVVDKNGRFNQDSSLDGRSSFIIFLFTCNTNSVNDLADSCWKCYLAKLQCFTNMDFPDRMGISLHQLPFVGEILCVGRISLNKTMGDQRHKLRKVILKPDNCRGTWWPSIYKLHVFT